MSAQQSNAYMSENARLRTENGDLRKALRQAKRELALELRRLLLTGFLRIDKRTVLYSV